MTKESLPGSMIKKLSYAFYPEGWTYDEDKAYFNRLDGSAFSLITRTSGESSIKYYTSIRIFRDGNWLFTELNVTGTMLEALIIIKRSEENYEQRKTKEAGA